MTEVPKSFDFGVAPLARAVRQFDGRPLPAAAVRDIHDVIRWLGKR